MIMTRLFLYLVLILFSLGFTEQAFALPFSIVPKAGTTLPTSILPGETLMAYYTVTNNTSITLIGNFVKYLPINVMQDTTADVIATDPCGFTFTLTPFGTGPTSSCTLKLLITGTVTACNCNQRQCLFICTSGGATCAGTSNPLNVTEGTPIFVSVGAFDSEALHNLEKPKAGILKDMRKKFGKYTYARRQTIAKSLAYQSTDGGSSWTNVPVTFVGTGDQELDGVNCFGDNCVAVGGVYDPPTTLTNPTAYMSSDHGASWTASFPPSPGYSVILYSVACQGDLCVAVGPGDAGASSDSAAGYFSTDAGSSWLMNNPTDSSTGFTILQNVSCPTNNCVVVGSAILDDPIPTREAIVYTTNDVGQTYSAVKILTHVAPQFVSELFGVSCLSDGHCTTVGRYVDGVTGETFPIAYTSTDFGATWSSPILPTKPVISGLTWLYGVSCVDSRCVAVGFYFDMSDTLEKPLSYISSDGGNTWTLSSMQPPVSGFNADLFKVTCLRNGLCNAVGAYVNGSVRQPITYRSTDFGDTWTQVFPPYQGSAVSFLLDVSS